MASVINQNIEQKFILGRFAEASSKSVKLVIQNEIHNVTTDTLT